MKKLFLVIMTSMTLIISGCGHLSLINSEIKQGTIPKLSNVIVCTDLDSYLGPEIFPVFWSKIRFALQEEGIIVKQFVFPPPGSIRNKPDLKYEAMQAGATHVIALYRGVGNVNAQGEYYTRTEIIAHVIDAKTGKEIWSANFDHRSGMTFVSEDLQANAIVDPIISAMKTVGLLRNDPPATKKTTSQIPNDTNTSSESKRKQEKDAGDYRQPLNYYKQRNRRCEDLSSTVLFFADTQKRA